MICNHYRGYDPKGLVMRAALGLAYFMNNHQDLRRICGPIENDLTYQTFRRVFDVDFVNHELWVSVDGVEESKRKLNAGKIDKAQFSDSLMWQDVDFGQLLIDIKGVEGSATAKYAFVKNIYDTENCYSVEEYLELHKTGQDDQLMAAVKGFKEYATIMTLEEVKEFVGADLYEYAFYNEMQNEKSHNKKDRITDEDPIEELELSIRTYNCLKRAGVATVVQLRLMSEEELLSCRNMGRKNVEAIRNILNDTIRIS